MFSYGELLNTESKMAVQPTPGRYLDVQLNKDSKMTLFTRNGTIFPGFTNDEILDSFQEFEARDDDVWICAYVKAGTHWIWEVVTMLLHNRSKLSSLPKENNMAEAVGAKYFAELASPRILNSHFPVHFMPSDVWKKHNKIIYITRNPKDSFVSWYFHVKNAGLMGSQCNVTLHEFYKAGFLDSSGVYDGWIRYNLEWQKKQRNNSSILFLKYEDIKKDHLGTIRTIATFLNSPRSEEVYKNIQMKTSFEYMKKNKMSHEEHSKTKPVGMGTFASDTSIYRKGKTDDWKNHFTVNLNEEFDKEYEEKQRDTGLIHYTYC